MTKPEWDTHMNTGILKDCPFCGGEAKESPDNEMEFIIECILCGCSIYRHNGDGDDYKLNCKKDWNRRV